MAQYTIDKIASQQQSFQKGAVISGGNAFLGIIYYLISTKRIMGFCYNRKRKSNFTFMEISQENYEVTDPTLDNSL